MQRQHVGRGGWEKTPGGRDNNNPDVSKQNRPTLGMPILIDMKKKPGVDVWEGQVYNAKDGQFYSSTIKPVGPDHLEIQGCVLGFLCGGETWTRVAGPDSLEPRQQHGQGGAEDHGRVPKTAAPARATCAGDSNRRTGDSNCCAGDSKCCAEDHRVRQPGSPKRRAETGGSRAARRPVGDICLLPDIAGFAH